MRLNLAKKDFIRAGIVRNKITVRIMKNLYELEVKYWNLSLILFYHHERQFLELSKAYFKLLSTHKTLLEGLPVFRQLLTLLTTQELMEWPLPEDMMAKVSAFKFVGVVDAQQTQLMERLKERV